LFHDKTNPGIPIEGGTNLVQGELLTKNRQSLRKPNTPIEV